MFPSSRNHRLGFLFCYVACCWSLASPEGAELVIPGNYSNQPGGAYGDIMRSAVEYQTTYQNSLLAGTVNGPIMITGIAFRLDDRETSSLAVVVPKMEIWLSTFPGPFSGLSTDRASNRGPDLTQVFSGENTPFQASSHSLSDFAIRITFEQAFKYDPAAGQLVFDFKTSGTYSGLGVTTDVAGYPSGNAPVALLLPERIPALIPYADILQLSYTIVPEPQISSVFLLSSILIAGSLLWRSRTR
jgi:hypothetical protein